MTYFNPETGTLAGLSIGERGSLPCSWTTSIWRTGGEKEILELLTDPLFCGERVDVLGVRVQYIDEPEGLLEFAEGLGLKSIPWSLSLNPPVLKLFNERYSWSSGESGWGDLGYDGSHEGVFTMAQGRREGRFRLGDSPVGSGSGVETRVSSLSTRVSIGTISVGFLVLL